MRWLRRLFEKRDDEIDRELRAHLELEAEEREEGGSSPDEARHAARRVFGNATMIQEDTRSAWGWTWLERVLYDLRYAARALRRDAGATAFAILIVGLGVGASTTVFSVVNAVLLRPLPFPEPERLVWISNIADDGVSEWKVQVNHFLDLRERNSSFSDMAAYFGFVDRGERLLAGDGEPERVFDVSVSQNLFPFLGVQPMLGRVFTAEECRFNAPRTVLLSHRLWSRRFSADANVVGRTVSLDGASATIVGVLPEWFDFGSVFSPGTRVDLFTPFPLAEETNRRGNTLAVIGRLRPGVAIETARQEFELLGEQLTQEFQNRNSLRPKLTPLNERVSGRFQTALTVLAWAVGLVMLIVCANLSNLQLARGAGRRKEMAVRVALGADRGRLIRQVLTESVLLSTCGAVLGVLVAVAGTRAISRLDAFSIPLLDGVRVDETAFGFTAAIAVATGLLFGLLPALHAPANAVHGSLKESSRGSSHGTGHAWTRRVLVVSEVALACVLLVGAGLLIRSFGRVLETSLGFQPARTAAVRVDIDRRSNLEQRNAFFDDVLRRARAVPGVQGAALADILPLRGNRSRGVAGRGQVYSREEYPQGFVRIVSEGYFASMGVPIREGRDFTARDAAGAEKVVILNEMLAEMLWPGEDPIGKEITADGGRRVVGIVGNVRHRSLEQGYTGELYLPIRQTFDYASIDLVVRTEPGSGAPASLVRNALEPVVPTIGASEWRPLQQYVARAVSPRRFLMLILAGFAGFALILASLGIYAVISYSVSQRRQELGIRMALGASAAKLQYGVLLQTLKLAMVGMAIGLAGAWALGRAIENLLFEIAPSDPATFVAAFAVLAAVAALAGYLPARRAARVNPAEALGSE